MSAVFYVPFENIISPTVQHSYFTNTDKKLYLSGNKSLVFRIRHTVLMHRVCYDNCFKYSVWVTNSRQKLCRDIWWWRWKRATLPHLADVGLCSSFTVYFLWQFFSLLEYVRDRSCSCCRYSVTEAVWPPNGHTRFHQFFVSDARNCS